MIDPSRIQKARGFLHLGTKDGYALVIESFTNLNAELQVAAINSPDHGGKAGAPSRYALIAASTHFVTGKLLDIFARLEMVDCMNRELCILPTGKTTNTESIWVWPSKIFMLTCSACWTPWRLLWRWPVEASIRRTIRGYPDGQPSS